MANWVGDIFAGVLGFSLVALVVTLVGVLIYSVILEAKSW